jgi:hypothetical protein
LSSLRSGNPWLAVNILVVFPVARTSYKRVARSRRSGRLVKLPRFWPSTTAAIFSGGGRGLLPRAGLEFNDSLELEADKDGPARGKIVGGRFLSAYREFVRAGEVGDAGELRKL